MNNAQFRRLVQETPNTVQQNGVSPSQNRLLGSQTPALGSRTRSNIPMTPRSLGGSRSNDFARQLAERNAELNGQQMKKFRSSAAPKGSKLGSRYTDRTQSRISEDEDEKSVRVKALEEQVKLGQLAPETFEALREQIIGGDVKDVHLVKGLDYKLLARVKRGEDVLSESQSQSQSQTSETKEPVYQKEPELAIDVDDELEKLESKEVQPLAKSERSKKGEMAAPPPPVAGVKRTRDDILKELKASRAKAAEDVKSRQPQLGPRFVKVGAKKETSRIEKDSKGREVLITTDAEGNAKRKVKKRNVEDEKNGLLVPNKDAAPLGMDVSAMTPVPAPVEQEDEDIFGEVGKEYDPLAGLANDDDDESDDSDDSVNEAESTPKDKPSKPSPPPQPSTEEGDSTLMPPPPSRRNYFNDTSPDDDSTTSNAPNPLQDPTILAALKKASTINPLTDPSSSSSSTTIDEGAARAARHRSMLANADRDAEDMDMEFGSSRFGDQDDGEEDGREVKLSVWDGEGGEKGGERKGGKKERKRAPKKRKGDVNSAADVLRVMEAKKAMKS